MQIHEITLVSRPPVAEGIFDTLKAAATWEPGETFAQAKAKVKTDAGVAAVAKKAQAAWQSYEQQLQKSVAQQPAVAAVEPPSEPPPPPPPSSSGVSVKTAAGNVVKGADGKWKSGDEEITNTADIQELERRAKQQATIAAQNKQMSPASGIREAVAPATPGSIAKRSASRNARVATTAPAAPAAPAQTSSPLEAYKNRTDGRYEQALKAFVQQNLLGGMPYARLQNAQDIDRLIKTMSQPQNANAKAQAPLWQQLALAAAVAAVVPQSAGGAGPNPTTSQNTNVDDTQAQSARELIEPVKQAMSQSQIDLSKPGQVLRSKFNNNETAIRSTGNPNVDAMLLAMGFTI